MLLAETRIKHETCIELSSGITLYNIRKKIESIYGVGFLINKRTTNQIRKYVGVSERMSMLVIKVNKNITTKMVQVYAPTSTFEDQEIEELYEQLTTALNR